MAASTPIYLGTNTKMYQTASQAAAHIRALAQYTTDVREQVSLFVIPSFTSLPAAVGAAYGSGIQIGAQNMGWAEQGQFTGEISPLMLQELGVNLVMIGHSERRHVFAETDTMERKKVTCALSHGMTVLLCVGETAEEKVNGIAHEVIASQLKIALGEIPSARAAGNLWIAYEPVWAIGVNGVPADESYANEIHHHIKTTLAALFGADTASAIPVLYGGSVNLENAPKLIVQSEIDGLFIGRSAWDASSFSRIIHCVLPLVHS